MQGSFVRRVSRLGEAALIAFPAALTIFLAFHAGGYFPGTVAAAALLVTLALLARVITVDRPFAGFGAALLIAAAVMGVYAGWVLLSASWSDAPWRALAEFDRALLYLLVLLLFGSVPRDPERIRWMVRCFAAALFAICLVGLITRLLPDVWSTPPEFIAGRLEYPVTYWNSLGLLAALGAIVAFFLTTSRGEPLAVRLLGAGAVPVFALTLYFTFSRGAILACAIGLVLYVVLARPRALLGGLLAVVPPTAVAVVAGYRADELAGLNPTSEAAIQEGHELALVAVLCIAGAVALRWLLARQLRRVDELHIFQARSPVTVALVSVVAVAAVVASVIAADVPDRVSSAYDDFVSPPPATISETTDQRTRLSDASGNHRVDHWSLAVDEGYEPDKLTGSGAGTYELLWAEHRPPEAAFTVVDAHSLYAETLGELGIVGLLLILGLVGVVIFGYASRLRGPHRRLYAALLALSLAWALRAGVDWDWEMPAVTLWVFAFAGATLARPSHRMKHAGPALRPVARAGAIAACLAVGVLPALVLVSQLRLDSAREAFLERDDCESAIADAQGSASVLGMQSEPYQLEAYCKARNGDPEGAVDDMAVAVENDPDNWEYLYGLAVVRAAAGLDPSAAASGAASLNPLDPNASGIAESLSSENEERWRSVGEKLLRRPVL